MTNTAKHLIGIGSEFRDLIFFLFRCHGKGVLEIKCPELLTKNTFESLLDKPAFCLKREGELMKLKEDHEYFYQVQAQMHVVEASYCDFMVWSPKEPPHIERIFPDTSRGK